MKTEMKCAYCGTVRDKVMFCIGASTDPDWVMHEGTGKISCPVCWERGRADGQAAVDRHCASFGYRQGE